MTIREVIQKTYPELITPCGIFTNIVTLDIGFINPDIPNYQGDGIANDETEFTFESLDEAEELYETFCNESGLPSDTVMYVEIPKSTSVVERLRNRFPEGTQIELLDMDDFQAPPAGTKGVVQHVDDIGTIHVLWDTGSTLGLVYGVDKFKVIGGAEDGR